jgi:hypothetical protein
MFFRGKRLSNTTLVLAVCLLSQLWASAQERSSLFENIERRISQNHPEWTLFEKWPNPNPQYKVITYQWVLGRDEILAWMVEEQSPDNAASRFYEIATITEGKRP